ncbi:hypothetical protein [uncultured Fibrella sp.]|uniref:hypothetical protein n=1 Tax=uncultured Fibrella sp. TaxID=1284596 RepID=UPI0035CA72F4
MPKAKEVTLDDEIKEQERELGMRERYYPDWTKGPKPRLSPELAEHRLACSRATLKRLIAQRDAIIAAKGIQQTLAL